MKEQKRWRAKDKGIFFSIIFLEIAHGFVVSEYIDYYDTLCDTAYSKGNYFRTKEEAQAAIEEMQKVLLRRVGELRDFIWVLEKMRQGNKISRKEWNNCEFPSTREKYIFLADDEFFEHTSFPSFIVSYEITFDDIEATDWEIY